VIGSLFLILPESVVGAALLFTASFMIAGGIQIMVSRNIDTRMTFVIGISMVLGLSKEVFQNFFKNLPHALHAVTNSTLSLAVISALALHIVFRIGTKRTATVEFEHAERSVEDLAAPTRTEWYPRPTATKSPFACTSIREKPLQPSCARKAIGQPCGWKPRSAATAPSTGSPASNSPGSVDPPSLGPLIAHRSRLSQHNRRHTWQHGNPETDGQHQSIIAVPFKKSWHSFSRDCVR
jgi:hypothetical protein